jgi:hypothetical protein
MADVRSRVVRRTNAARATFPAIFVDFQKWFRGPAHYFIAAGFETSSQERETLDPLPA